MTTRTTPVSAPERPRFPAAPGPWGPRTPTAGDDPGWGEYVNVSQRVSDPMNGPEANVGQTIDVEFDKARAGETMVREARYIGENLASDQYSGYRTTPTERKAAAALRDAIRGSGLLDLPQAPDDDSAVPVDHARIRYNVDLGDGEREVTFQAPLDDLPAPFVTVFEALEAYQDAAGRVTPEQR